MFKHLVWVSLLLVARPLAAEQTQDVSGLRIELGELVPSVPAELQSVDVGRCPPPGGSRLITRAEMRRQISAAGFAPTTADLPDVIRARAPGITMTGAQLAELARSAIERALPAGADLSTLSVSHSLTLAPGVGVGTVTLPPIPKRPGSVRLGVNVELLSEGEVAHRLTVMAVVNLSTKTARYTVVKGGIVRLSLQRKSARIEAEGTALASGDVGQVLSFRVTNSNKTIRARVLSEREAVVTEGQ